MKRTRLILGAVLVAGVASFVFGSWSTVSLRSIVHTQSELIVSGKITEIKQDTTNRFPVVGVIQVESVIYGPPDTKHVLLSVWSRVGGGNSYRVGDSGTWFLKQHRTGEIAEKREREMSAPPLCGEHVSGTVFEADNPQTFWPDKPDELGKRHGTRYKRLTPEKESARMQQLLSLVKRRLDSDIRYLRKKQKETSDNLKQIDALLKQSKKDR